MKIHQFNTKKGIYHFELEELDTTFHSHPTFEILLSKNGEIELETPHHRYQNIDFAIVAPNLPHQVKKTNGNIVVLMLECNSFFMQSFLSSFDIQLSEGIFVKNQKGKKAFIIDELIQSHQPSTTPIAADRRINKCVDYLNHSSSEYTKLITDLKSQTNLSNSRLSHLFKKELGISIKKYFVWSKLKRAFEKVIYENKTMYEASLEVGFYDQAHLSRAFKQMLGMRPSDVYNSRMIQV